MQHLLRPTHRPKLQRLLAAGALLAFDYDGTLAPIATDRHAAGMRPATRQLFESLAQRCACAVLSGRELDDLLSLLPQQPLAGVAGNHGAEVVSPWKPEFLHRGRPECPGHYALGADLAALDGARRTVAEWRTRLHAALAGLHGIEVEDKGLSLSIHYRAARDQEAMQHAARVAAVPLDGARVTGGRRVINVIPASLPHKGDALLRMVRQSGSRAALYVGDDVTDEDAFGLQLSEPLLTVRVGRSAQSRAAYYLRDQDEVDELLALLLGLSESAPRSERRT